ncbi:MAG: hypothetical protein JWR29_414 [Tardiphaga sp.]|nr:hypothetical protein [Tardiphaga sp.]
MTVSATFSLPREMAADLERRFFWWEQVGTAPRSDVRILAQAMRYASFAEVRRLETAPGVAALAAVMLSSEPGWLDERSWEFWRGRLMRATGQVIPNEAPRRSIDVDLV